MSKWFLVQGRIINPFTHKCDVFWQWKPVVNSVLFKSCQQLVISLKALWKKSQQYCYVETVKSPQGDFVVQWTTFHCNVACGLPVEGWRCELTCLRVRGWVGISHSRQTMANNAELRLWLRVHVKRANNCLEPWSKLAPAETTDRSLRTNRNWQCAIQTRIYEWNRVDILHIEEDIVMICSSV